MIFIEAPPFMRWLDRHTAADASEIMAGIQTDLLQNPSRGVLVRGLEGIRKARIANPARGKGKRGGFRYFYLYFEHRGHIHLLWAIDKNDEEDLSATEREMLKQLARRLREL